jgi:hypothetical protein
MKTVWAKPEAGKKQDSRIKIPVTSIFRGNRDALGLAEADSADPVSDRGGRRCRKLVAELKTSHRWQTDTGHCFAPDAAVRADARVQVSATVADCIA